MRSRYSWFIGGSLVFAFSLLSFPALAEQDFAVVGVKLNQVMQPKSVMDAGQDCARSEICRTLVDAAATWFGAEPGTVSGAMAAIPKAERKGEDGNYVFQLPAGYQYCRSKIKTISVVPATGDRASYMGVSTTKKGMAAYTWTPRQGLGGGRSWVEADFTIVGVRDSAAEKYRAAGKCKPFGHTIVTCRGAKGTNKGKPACGSYED